MSEVAVLIDDETIVQNHLHISLPHVRTKAATAVVFIISSSVLTQLNQSKDRIGFINSGEFVVLGRGFLLYQKDVCIIHDLSHLKAIPFIINSCNASTTFQICVQMSEMSVLKSYGFVSLESQNDEDGTICMIRKSIHNMFQIAPSTVHTLRSYLNIHTEVAGAFRTSNTLVINTSTIVKGDGESVKVLNDKYNFHTHPIEAYIRNGVSYAWPSEHDYLGFMRSVLYSDSVFHVVVTNEGLYILSMSDVYKGHAVVEGSSTALAGGEDNKFGGDSRSEDLMSKVEEIYGSKSWQSYTYTDPYDYISKVNRLGYFNVQYMTWDNAGKSFYV